MPLRTTVAYTLGLLVAGVVLWLTWSGMFEAAESRFVDWKFRNRPLEEAIDQNVALVEVTDDCLRRHGDLPWRRSQWAKILEATRAVQAKTVGMDLLFDEPSKDPAEDAAFARAIEAAGNVILASELKTRVEVDTDTGELRKVVYVRSPFGLLERGSRDIGIVNIDFIYDNVDGILRVMPLAQRLAGRLVPTLALACAADYLGVKPSFDAQGDLILGTYCVPGARAKLRGDIDRLEGENILRSAAEASAYVNYSPLTNRGVFNVLTASAVLAAVDGMREAERKPESDPSRVAEIARFAHQLEPLRGKVVLVGVNATGIDMKTVPYGPMAGVEAQANVVRNLLEQDFLVRIPLGWHLAGLAALGLLLPLMFLRRAIRGSALVAAALMAGLAGSSVVLFDRAGFLLDVYPGTALVAGQFVLMKLWLLTFDLRGRIRNLELLNFYSRRFNSTLNLEELRTIIQDSYTVQAGAQASILAVGGELPDELGVYPGSAPLPEGAAEWVKSPELKQALREFWSSHGARPVLLSELEDQTAPGGYAEDEVVVMPLLHREEPEGWLALMGRRLEPSVRGEEDRTFWTMLSSVAYTALVNARHYELATIDGLTRLQVRHMFDTEIEKEFGRASRYGGKLSLLLTDIDHFKSFNDTYGHQLGDRVLRQVADQVKRSIRLSDTAARYGGEEFAVILPETEFDGANLLAERIRTRIEEMRVPHEGKQLEVTISIGLATLSSSKAKNAKGFIQEADMALYAAKQGGRNQVKSWAEGMELKTKKK